MKTRLTCRQTQAAFTLLELLTAVFVFAIVLAAMNTVFYSALRLQTRVTETLESSRSMNRALSLMQKDFLGTVPSGGVMSGNFKIGAVSASLNQPQTLGIEFRTATAILSENEPWGDIQKVIYQLRDPLNRTDAKGMDLVRSVTRNLLPTTLEEIYEERLVRDVELLEFYGYNGIEWRSTWDTLLTETNMPTAIRVRIQLATDPSMGTRGPEPTELIIPIAMQSPTPESTEQSE